MINFYILDDDLKPVHVSPVEFEAWFAVNQDFHLVEDYIGEVHISTVFIGLHRPIFETMVFAPSWLTHQLSVRQCRYETAEEAKVGHAEVVAEVRTLTLRN